MLPAITQGLLTYNDFNSHRSAGQNWSSLDLPSHHPRPVRHKVNPAASRREAKSRPHTPGRDARGGNTTWRCEELGTPRHVRDQHLTALFYLSDVMLRTETTCTYLTPRASVSDGAEDCLTPLRPSRHTLLYLFHHTCLWAINNFRSVQYRGARLPQLCSKLSTNRRACVCMG